MTGPSGKGINSTTDNGDGTFTFDYTDGTSFTTSDLTGPQGNTSSGSQVVITDTSNLDNLILDNGTIVYNKSNGKVYLYTTYGSSTSGLMFTDASSSSSFQSGNNFILSFKVSQEMKLSTIFKGVPESSYAYVYFYEDIDNDINNGIGSRIDYSTTTTVSQNYVNYNSVLSPNYTYNVFFNAFNKNLREAPISSLDFDSDIFTNLVFYKTTSSVINSNSSIPQSLQVSNTYPYNVNVSYSIIDGSPTLILIN